MNKKAVSALLAVSMLAGVITGCSHTTNITTDGFEKACKTLKLEQYDIDDVYSIEPGDVEDGINFVCDEDETEELIDRISEKDFNATMKKYRIDDVINADTVRSFGIAAKCEGIDVINYDDLDEPSDIELDGAFAIQLTLDDDGRALDFMDCIEDLLDLADIEVKDLTSREYDASKKEGYFRFHIDVSKFIDLVLDNEDIEDMADDDLSEDLEDVIGDLTGDIVISIEINGANIFVLGGGSVNTRSTVLDDFVKAFGVYINPKKIPMNDNVSKGMIEGLADSLSAYLKLRSEYGTQIDPVDPVDPTGGTSGEPAENLIGISLPTKDLMRWNNDGDRLKTKLVDMGYQVDLQYASNDVNTQRAQIQNMIDEGCKLLIIASIDSISLGDVLDLAKERGVQIIAYDRLIMETSAVDYYVTFDKYMTGVLQGTYVVNALDLDNARGTFNIEFTAGEPSDSAAMFFYMGAYDVLRPYIESGKLIVVSGQVEFEDVGTPNWSTVEAQSRAEKIIASYYIGGTNIDAWICSNDSTALGVILALDAFNGYGYSGKWPIITGQDCDITNVKSIIAGQQAMSVFKDTRTLVDETATMADQIMRGVTVDVNDNSTYNNGVIVVPAMLCDPIFVDINNYKTILIDSGYYTEDQIG